MFNKIQINNKDYDMSSPNSEEFKERYIESFGDKKNQNKSETIEIITNNVDGFYVELKSNSTELFKVEVLDNNDHLIYSTELKSGTYSKLNRKYYTKWKTKIFQNETLISEDTFSLTNGRVLIVFESKSTICCRLQMAFVNATVVFTPDEFDCTFCRPIRLITYGLGT